LGLFYFYPFSSFKSRYTFYHWKSTYEINASQKHPPHYIKVLDIAFNETLVFRKTVFKTSPSQAIVPVIYMDNPLWLKMRATTMVSKVLQALKKMPIVFNEIQVDCDWTDRTRASYFNFLKLLKEKSAKKLSVTIRLHQVKYYSKTGVPPVDYGVLMYYNMSDFQNLATKNYILDLEIAKRYHYNFDTYPLPLNLALPLYSQATIIRFSQVVGIIEGVREHVLNENFKKIRAHYYKIIKTHYFRGRLLYKGDEIRIDEVNNVLLEETISELKKKMKQPKEIFFYRWENRTFYGDAFLEHLVKSW
jgi:hypothetical protein